MTHCQENSDRLILKGDVVCINLQKGDGWDTSMDNRLVEAPGKRSLFFHPKLTVGPAGDVYEREADAMADKVMKMNDAQARRRTTTPVVQPECAHCAREEVLQRKESDHEEDTSTIDLVIQSPGNAMDSTKPVISC